MSSKKEVKALFKILNKVSSKIATEGASFMSGFKPKTDAIEGKVLEVGGNLDFRVSIPVAAMLVDVITNKVIARPSRAFISYLDSGQAVLEARLTKQEEVTFKCPSVECPEDHQYDAIIYYKELGKSYGARYASLRAL